MDIDAFQSQERMNYHPLKLVVAIERHPRILCAFTARLRVATAAELMSYLQLLAAMLRSVGTEVA